MEGLELYLKSNPLMDMTLSGLSKEPITFNTVDECMFTFENIDKRHELISGKIAFVNGLLEKFRDRLLAKKAELKRSESQTWANTKNTAVDANNKALSDKRVDMQVQFAEPLVGLNNEILTMATNVRRLDIFVQDLRGAKVAMETILKTRVI